MSKIFALLALAMLAVPTPGNAAAVTWYVNGNFNDGGTVTGSFAYDASNDTFSSIALTTTGGTILAGASYANVTSEAAADADFADFRSTGPIVLGTTTRLSLFLNANMTDAGGTISYAALSEQICVDAGCPANIGATVFRSGSPGNITTTAPVPLPAAAWLLLSGLGGLGFVARRRKAA